MTRTRYELRSGASKEADHPESNSASVQRSVPVRPSAKEKGYTFACGRWFSCSPRIFPPLPHGILIRWIKPIDDNIWERKVLRCLKRQAFLFFREWFPVLFRQHRFPFRNEVTGPYLFKYFSDSGASGAYFASHAVRLSSFVTRLHCRGLMMLKKEICP